jgi:hypothetical protein
VPGPALLVADLARGIPARAVDQPDREIGHARSVRAVTDIQTDPLQRRPSGRPAYAAWCAMP